MFGLFEKKEAPKIVGAKEKIRQAQMLKKGMSMEDIQSKREGKQTDSPAVSIVLIYVLSCAVAYFLMEGPWKNGAPLKIGHSDLDDLFFGAGAAVFSGDRDIDFLITVFFRGLFIFAAGGAMPGLAFLWMRGLDRTNMNPFRTVWGVSVGVVFIYFVFKEGIIPLIETMM